MRAVRVGQVARRIDLVRLEPVQQLPHEGDVLVAQVLLCHGACTLEEAAIKQMATSPSLNHKSAMLQESDITKVRRPLSQSMKCAGHSHTLHQFTRPAIIKQGALKKQLMCCRPSTCLIEGHVEEVAVLLGDAGGAGRAGGLRETDERLHVLHQRRVHLRGRCNLRTLSLKTSMASYEAWTSAACLDSASL